MGSTVKLYSGVGSVQNGPACSGCHPWSECRNVTATATSDLQCEGLPTQPRPEIGPVLVTGATGYIGGRLVPELLARGYTVRAMVRAASPEHADRWPRAQTVVADAGDPAALEAALSGVHTAYYLIHSLLLGPKRFEHQELANAHHFRVAAERCGVRRIVYLGGLGDVRTVLSPHLRSRADVAEELTRGPVPVTVLRAAIIIGSGSASYEIIHHLVLNVPVFVTPRWSRTRCQPIAIRDVIRYLVGVLEEPRSTGESYDIGGPEVLEYEQMVRSLAETSGRRRFFLRLPTSNFRFFAYMTGLLTPVPVPITISLMEGLKNDVVCANSTIQQLIPFRTLTYREAVVEAMTRYEQDRVHTRWSDSYPPAHELALKLHELPQPLRFVTTYAMTTTRPAEALFRSFCRIGGREGWFDTNWLWHLRGTIDRVLAGVGTQRGRRSASQLRVNDVVDFWRVEDLQRNRRLLLRAEMKLPGWAWLEFAIDDAGERRKLSVTGHYKPKGILGYLYWYACLPLHVFIFRNLILRIERRS